MALPERAGLRPPGPILLALLAAAIGLLVLHARLYGSWIDDDAGISFTYARNLAEGHGLVLNPGGERVEGYSNPAWVFLLALLMKAGLFDPVLTPKVLGVAFASGTFYLLARISARISGWPASPLHAMPAILLACSVPFVAWALSGLENALFTLLLAAGLNLHLGEMEGRGRIPWSAPVFFLLAVTRPEGILYGCAALAHRMATSAFKRNLLVPTAAWIALLAAPLAAYHAWHYDYFADPLPNTYYAKVERGADLAWRLDKEVYDLDSTGWKYVRGANADYLLGWVLAPCLLLSLVRFRRRSPAILLAAIVAALDVFYAIYVGGDWMEQYRFLGPLVLVTALMAATATMAVRLERDPALHDPSVAGTRAEGRPQPKPAGSIGDDTPQRRFAIRTRAVPLTARRRSLRLASGALMAAAAGAIGWLLIGPNAWILEVAQPAPSVSFSRVAERGRAFGDLARDLLLEDASVMDPDLGGTSWASGLRVVDLGGLADAHIARHRYDPRFFVPYVLEEKRPTFVRTHCVWSRDTRINEHAAFREAYLPLWERPCPLPCCREHLDGEYVRRDVLVAPSGFEPQGGREHAFRNRLVLLGWEIDRTLASPGDTLRLETWWSARGGLPADLRYGVSLRSGGGVLHAVEREFTRGIYPPALWKPGEVVREAFLFEIPEGVARGRHRLVLAPRGEGIGGEAILAEVEVDPARAKDEAEDLFLQAQRAAAGGEHETALGYLEHARALRPHSLAYEEEQETVRAALAEAAASRAGSLSGEGRDDEAADLLLSALRRTGRLPELDRALREISGAFHRAAVELRSGPESFLRWGEALAAYRRALECDPSDSAALMAAESLRGREYVDRTWGEALRTLHAGGDGPEPIVPFLEGIQDEGFAEEILEVVAGSPPVRSKLESEGSLGALALLHQAAAWSGDEGALVALAGRIRSKAATPVDLGGRLVYLGNEMQHAPDGRTRISWWFEVTGRMRTDYRVFLHGYVKDRSILPEERRQYEFANFDHDVKPPTSRWAPGSVVRHTWKGTIPPGEYRFLFGFYNSKENASLKPPGKETAAVEMGWRTIPGPGPGTGDRRDGPNLP